MKKILLMLVLALSFSISGFADDGHTPISGLAGGHTPISGAADNTSAAGNADCLPNEQCTVDNDILDDIIDFIFGVG
jgi:hypothetical protein